jgi:uracil-DNA glycosylase
MAMKIEKTWHQVLQEELKKPYIQELKNFLESEKKSGFTVYPPEERIFNAFSQTPFDQVKVVIMGQDPYHGPNQAHGLSFSVPCGITPPPSLKNIFKEIKADLGIDDCVSGCLESWAKQGVLLLNATLTVRAKEPRSHYGMGWERFTDAVVEALCKKKDPVVFLLWGKSAFEKCANILNKINHPHVVLIATHPSPYSAAGFLGCKHFSKTNELLAKWEKSPINWKTDRE